MTNQQIQALIQKQGQDDYDGRNVTPDSIEMFQYFINNMWNIYTK